MNRNIQIANTIVQQLGGTGKLVMMVGAWNLRSKIIAYLSDSKVVK